MAKRPIYSIIVDTGRADWVNLHPTDAAADLAELGELTGIEFRVERQELGGSAYPVMTILADLDTLRKTNKHNARGAGRKPQPIMDANGDPVTVGMVRQLLAEGWSMATIREAYGVPRSTWDKRWANARDYPDDFMI